MLASCFALSLLMQHLSYCKCSESRVGWFLLTGDKGKRPQDAPEKV